MTSGRCDGVLHLVWPNVLTLEPGMLRRVPASSRCRAVALGQDWWAGCPCLEISLVPLTATDVRGRSGLAFARRSSPLCKGFGGKMSKNRT